MFTHGYQLKTDADFHNAILFRIVVSVTQEGVHIGSGLILSQSYHVVKMIEAFYFKYSCDFTVCSIESVKNLKL
jgi:hypothetical protein